MILLVPSMWGIPSGGSVTRSGIWRTARHSAKWPTHNSWMSTRFLNQFLEMWDPQALLVNGVSTNHRTAFAGKIFTGNHVFFSMKIMEFSCNCYGHDCHFTAPPRQALHWEPTWLSWPSCARLGVAGNQTWQRNALYKAYQWRIGENHLYIMDNYFPLPCKKTGGCQNKTTQNLET